MCTFSVGLRHADRNHKMGILGRRKDAKYCSRSTLSFCRQQQSMADFRRQRRDSLVYTPRHILKYRLLLSVCCNCLHILRSNARYAGMRVFQRLCAPAAFVAGSRFRPGPGIVLFPRRGRRACRGRLLLRRSLGGGAGNRADFHRRLLSRGLGSPKGERVSLDTRPTAVFCIRREAHSRGVPHTNTDEARHACLEQQRQQCEKKRPSRAEFDFVSA